MMQILQEWWSSWTAWLPQTAFAEFFGKNMRGPLFSGFLTITGFLFSIKTFLLVQLKKEVYDQPIYRDRVERLRPLEKDLNPYRTLSNLNRLIVVVMTITLTTASLQITVGLVEVNWASVICLSSVAIAVMSLFAVLWVESTNMNRMFMYMEQHRIEEMTKKVKAEKEAELEAKARAIAAKAEAAAKRQAELAAMAAAAQRTADEAKASNGTEAAAADAQPASDQGKADAPAKRKPPRGGK